MLAALFEKLWPVRAALAVAPRGNSPTIFRGAKGKDMCSLAALGIRRPSLPPIPLWKLTAALYYTNSLFSLRRRILRRRKESTAHDVRTRVTALP